MFPVPEYHIRYAELGIIWDLFSTRHYPLRGKAWIRLTIARRACGIVENVTKNTFLPRRG
jgi:hypothetical protein